MKFSRIISGLIAVGICQLLCEVLVSSSMSEMGRDGAACALAFLTHVPEACRQGPFIKVKYILLSESYFVRFRLIDYEIIY